MSIPRTATTRALYLVIFEQLTIGTYELWIAVSTIVFYFGELVMSYHDIRGRA